MNLCQYTRADTVIYISTIFNVYKHKYINGNSDFDSIIHHFINSILNGCIRFIWINATYIMANFSMPYCNVTDPLVHNPTLCYLIWYVIRCFIFEISIVIEYDFNSDFIFMVYSFTIFADVIFINLCLILLMY